MPLALMRPSERRSSSSSAPPIASTSPVIAADSFSAIPRYSSVRQPRLISESARLIESSTLRNSAVSRCVNRPALCRTRNPHCALTIDSYTRRLSARCTRVVVVKTSIDCERRSMERSAPVARKTPSTTGSHSPCGTPAVASSRCEALLNRLAADGPLKFIPATDSRGSRSTSPAPSVSDPASAVATVSANARASTAIEKRSSRSAVRQVEPAAPLACAAASALPLAPAAISPPALAPARSPATVLSGLGVADGCMVATLPLPPRAAIIPPATPTPYT